MKNILRILIFVLFGMVGATAAEKAPQKLDRKSNLEDLRESINLFFGAPLFDEKLEKQNANPCVGIFKKFQNENREALDANLKKLAVRFPYFVHLGSWGNSTTLSFYFHHFEEDEELEEQYDISFTYDDRHKLTKVWRSGGMYRIIQLGKNHR